MFRRIKDTIRILSYKEAVPHPDLESSKDSYVSVTRAGKRIALVLTGVIAVIIGNTGYRALDAALSRNHKFVASATASQIIPAAFSLIAFWVFENWKGDMFVRLDLPHRLEPYFGHRIESALRIIRAK